MTPILMGDVRPTGNVSIYLTRAGLRGATAYCSPPHLTGQH